jgi:two-component system, NtrC family, response regulator HydG
MARMTREQPDDAVTAIEPRRAAEPRIEYAWEILVASGPDAGERHRIEAPCPQRVFLGQSPACEIRLNDRTVSRRHGAIEVRADGLRYTDLGSTNGSFAGNLCVLDVVLRSGDELRVGQTTLRVQADRPTQVVDPAVSRFGSFVGASSQMRRLYPLCARLAASEIPVVIEGETGTGKEVLAEAIHAASGRASAPLVVFDCTTVSPSLAEAALFGHERGAFTGALASRPGPFEEADKGTLLIDEIGDLDIALQAKLLRAIERGEVRRVGGSKWVHVDVRVLVATRRDLDKEVQEGRFRDDLFYRLAVARIEIPPLRQRAGDISLLASHFWQQMGGDPSALAADFLARLEQYSWPGNVRELRNAIARRLALRELAFVAADAPDAPSASQAGADPMQQVLELDLPFPVARRRMLEEFESRYVLRVLDQHDGNVGKAAAASGIGRRYFQMVRGRNQGQLGGA